MQRLGLRREQELHIVELPGGGFQALPYDPDFAKTMELVEATALMLAVAAGEVSEESLARWIRDNWPDDERSA